jgi:hypothetical protein
MKRVSFFYVFTRYSLLDIILDDQVLSLKTITTRDCI